MGIKPERWYVSGRYNIAGPIKEFTPIAVEPKNPIRLRSSEKLLDIDPADSRSPSTENFFRKLVLLVEERFLSSLVVLLILPFPIFTTKGVVSSTSVILLNIKLLFFKSDLGS